VRKSLKAIPAGSGTLVRIDNRSGILTAAHVLEEIPERGKIGLARTAGKPFTPPQGGVFGRSLR